MQRPRFWRERAVRICELLGGRHIAVILDDTPAIDAWPRFEHQYRQTCIQHLLGDQATHDPGSGDDDVCTRFFSHAHH
jgi:hypothetical protein